MARIIDVIVESDKNGFSCFMTGADDLKFGIVGDGKTAREAMEDFRDAYREMREEEESHGETLPDIDFNFIFDVGAFFDYYPINVTSFAKYIGMNPSLLRQYVSGVRSPKGKSLNKIREGISILTKDIAAGHLIDRPVLQYV
mgnify:FL=1